MGLVELTRKRQGQNIYELFGQKCSCCEGLGHTENLPNPQKIDIDSKKSTIKKSKKSYEGIHEPNNHIDQYEIKGKNSDKEIKNTSVLDNNSTNIKKKENNNDVSNHFNEKEVIYVELSEEEKFVYSQLGINPLIKMGKEFLNTNHSVQLDITKNNNRINNEKNIKKSNNKKLKEENDTQIADLENNIISIDESSSQNIVNKNFSDLDDSELNEEIDNSRRKRRRSSATDD